ncbi:hypothetical protein H9P43_000329 [Blastocladiella emersonii ATCC 22665]|nr:hypothetical protein H9P43_000329 [Blastocladiella emersonii ATCC 22665]
MKPTVALSTTTLAIAGAGYARPVAGKPSNQQSADHDDHARLSESAEKLARDAAEAAIREDMPRLAAVLDESNSFLHHLDVLKEANQLLCKNLEVPLNKHLGTARNVPKQRLHLPRGDQIDLLEDLVRRGREYGDGRGLDSLIEEALEEARQHTEYILRPMTTRATTAARSSRARSASPAKERRSETPASPTRRTADRTVCRSSDTLQSSRTRQSAGTRTPHTSSPAHSVPPSRTLSRCTSHQSSQSGDGGHRSHRSSSHTLKTMTNETERALASLSEFKRRIKSMRKEGLAISTAPPKPNPAPATSRSHPRLTPTTAISPPSRSSSLNDQQIDATGRASTGSLLTTTSPPALGLGMRTARTAWATSSASALDDHRANLPSHELLLSASGGPRRMSPSPSIVVSDCDSSSTASLANVTGTTMAGLLGSAGSSRAVSISSVQQMSSGKESPRAAGPSSESVAAVEDPPSPTKRHQRFVAKPVPASTLMPRYHQLMRQGEQRRKERQKQYKELLETSLTPFKFEYSRSLQERREATRARIEAEKGKSAPKKPRARARPQSAPPMEGHVRPAASKRKNVIPRSNEPGPDHTFRPRINPAVPDFAAAQEDFAERLARRRQRARVTDHVIRVRPFEGVEAHQRELEQRKRRTLERVQAELDRGSSPPPLPLLPSGSPRRPVSPRSTRAADLKHQAQTELLARRQAEAEREEAAARARAEKDAQLRKVVRDAMVAEEQARHARAEQQRGQPVARNARKALAETTQEYAGFLETMERRLQARPLSFQTRLDTKGEAQRAVDARLEELLAQNALDRGELVPS